MSLNIPVIYGSVRTERMGIRAARFVTARLRERGHQVTLIDPAEETYRLPFLDRMYKEYEPGTAPAPVQAIADLLDAVDAFCIVSGEWNHGEPPVLKNLLDHFQAEYLYKPSAIVTYSAGPFGGVRALITLRAILAELGTAAIPSAFPISKIGQSFDEDGNALDPAYERRIGRFLDELEWYGRALKAARGVEEEQSEAMPTQQAECRGKG